MAAHSDRHYDVRGYRKHKRPDGWGSLCPDDLRVGDAQRLLEGAVIVDGAAWAVDGERLFEGFEHEPGRWHGFPVAWSRLTVAARRELIARGLLDEATWRKAVRKGWGSNAGTGNADDR